MKYVYVAMSLNGGQWVGCDVSNSQEHALFDFHFQKIRQDGQGREKHLLSKKWKPGAEADETIQWKESGSLSMEASYQLWTSSSDYCIRQK